MTKSAAAPLARCGI